MSKQEKYSFEGQRFYLSQTEQFSGRKHLEAEVRVAHICVIE